MTTAYETGQVPQIEVRHRLRIAREYAKLEQRELAEHIGVSRTTIGNAETGVVAPRRITVNAWALACGVPVSWILTGDVESSRPHGPGGGPTGDANPGTSDYKAEVCRLTFGKPKPTSGKAA